MHIFKLLTPSKRSAGLHKPKPGLRAAETVKATTAADPQAVQTPKEVYQALKAEGYRVNYHRVPLTDGVAPGEAAFDMFFEHLKDARAEDPLVFNCQMGSGRTTTGMVMGCLIRMHTTGQPAGRHACAVTNTRRAHHHRDDHWLPHPHAYHRSACWAACMHDEQSQGMWERTLWRWQPRLHCCCGVCCCSSALSLPLRPCRQWAVDRAPGGAAHGVLPKEHHVRGLCCRGVR